MKYVARKGSASPFSEYAFDVDSNELGEGIGAEWECWWGSGIEVNKANTLGKAERRWEDGFDENSVLSLVSDLLGPEHRSHIPTPMLRALSDSLMLLPTRCCQLVMMHLLQ